MLLLILEDRSSPGSTLSNRGGGPPQVRFLSLLEDDGLGQAQSPQLPAGDALDLGSWIRVDAPGHT